MSPEHIQKWLHQKLFHQVPVDIAVIDREYRIVEANQRFEERYGPWKDRFCYEAYKGRSKPCTQCAAAQTFLDGRVRVKEERGRIRDGKAVYYMVHLAPLRDPENKIRFVIEMSTDVTEFRELEERLQRVEQEKLEAERLAAVAQTVAGLAHGVKNVLMGLEGGMYVLRSGIRKKNDDRVERGWQMLEGNIQRISSFVREFLDFARGRREPRVEVIDPNGPAREVLELFRAAAAREKIELVGNLAQGLEPASMDAEEIHTCLANLVSNAIDACEMSTQTDSRVVLSTRDEDGTLVYKVEDNGLGMDYELKQKVFTTFFSTKASGKGTGLGLLVTRRIVQGHGGQVTFESTKDKGSVFRMELPRSRLPEPGSGGQDE